MASDRMMEYYYAMGQDGIHTGRFDDAILYFRKAARLGAREAAADICLLGHWFATGDGAPKDEDKAAACYEMASEFDLPEAFLAMGKMYLKGINGKAPNLRKARKQLEKASDMGSTDAAALLGKLFDEGTFGRVAPDKAFQYYLLAAQRGDASSMLMTGLFYAEGKVVPKDTAIAETWIRKGNELGDPDGKETLRTFLAVACTEYVTGDAGIHDDAKALAMAEEAMALGDKEAWQRLGEAYRDRDRRSGHGEKSFQCFEKSAALGLPAGETALGLAYEAGIGTEADIAQAVRWYQKGADKGDAFAMARLGYAYGEGAGVSKDEQKAMEWLIKAAMKGDAGAILTLRDDYHYEWK